MCWETWIGDHPLAIDVQGDSTLRWHLFAQGDREAEGPPILSAPAEPVLANGWLKTVREAGGVTFLDGGPPVALTVQEVRELVSVLAACESVRLQTLDIIRERLDARIDAVVRFTN